MAVLSVFTIILSLLTTELSFVFAGFGTVTAYHPPYLPTRCNGNGQEQFPPGNLFVAVGECLWDNGAACGSLWGNGATCGRRYRLRCISGNNKPCKGNTINQFPISLTMIHMFFCGTLAFLLIKVFKFVEPVTMSRCLFLSSVVPIGALYSLSLWLSNSAYIYLSVSFIQMLKALMPVAVYSIGVTFKKESFKSDTMCNMVSISVGVAIAAYGEAKFDSWGVVLQLGAVAFEAMRLVMIQILLTSKGITLNPITSLYYVAPCCLVFLLVPWIFVELPILRETSSFHFDFEIFGTNSLCAFALNLAVFLLVGKTSPLTMNVAGVVKDWLLIAFSWSAIKDTITPINLFGYGLAFSGVAYYSISKLLALKAKEAQKKAQQADEEAGKVLEERDGEGGGSTNRNESQD